MTSPYRPPLMITVDEAASLMSMTPKALYGQIYRGTSGLIVRRGGKTLRVSLKSVLAVAGMTLSEYIDWQGETAGAPRTKIRGAA
ncbi:hypothetical protein [Corynebacterium sp. AOP40-4SA-5]|uniref:hypothetical protein n=1 Tax=Corynebacterium sp. AOP40-4SA-5 TaxID=3457678 RepID=UPI004034ABA4